MGGYVYGTIVALSALVASAQAFPNDADRAAVLVASTAGMLWIAHVYAHSLGESVARGEHLSWNELRAIGWRELSIIEAAVPLVGALLLGSTSLMSERHSVWLALALGLAMLGTQGFRFAQREGLRTLATVGVVVLNLSFGVGIVLLKVLLLH